MPHTLRLPTLAAAGVALALLAPPLARPALAQPAEPRLTLRAVVDSAVARHPVLEAARARVRAARGSRVTAGTLGNPMLMYQAENTPFPGGAALGMPAEHMTTATVPLAPLYQRGARVRQADAVVRAADADARAARQAVALDAARAYYRTAVAAVSADAAEGLAAWLDSVVAYNRTRVSQGVAAEADLIRSQLERDRALADAGLEAAELARARAELSAFLGDPDRASAEVAVAIADTPLPLPAARALADVPPTPVVAAARERLAAAGAGAALEQRLLVRDLGATLGVKRMGGTSSMVAGGSVPLPLFDRNRGEVARARAERDAAAFELSAQERAARAAVLGAEAAARILTARAALLAVRDSTGAAAYLARADEARAIALGAYREGAVPLLQVLDAARAWGEARVAYFRTLYAQHDAVLSLLVARGEDLAAALPTLTPSP